MIFEKVDRVVVAVKDIEKARDFFSDLLGMQFHDIHEDHEFQLKVSLPKNVGIELLAPLTADSMIGRFIKEKGEGVWAIVIRVSDLDKAAKIFKEKGIRTVAQLTRCGSREIIFDAKDTYGVLIVINEYPDVSPVGVEVDKYFKGK